MRESMEQQLLEQRTDQRTFEAFLRGHVRRQQLVNRAISWMYWLMAAACVVMSIAALVMRQGIGGSIFILLIGGGAAASAAAFRTVSRNYGEAGEEIAYGLEHPECNVPDDYEDNTKSIRKSVCGCLRSVRSLVIAYGLIALLLLGCFPVLLWASGVTGAFDFSPLIFAVSFILPAMAVPLAALSISYLLGYGETKKFMPRILEVLEPDTGGS